MHLHFCFKFLGESCKHKMKKRKKNLGEQGLKLQNVGTFGRV